MINGIDTMIWVLISLSYSLYETATATRSSASAALLLSNLWSEEHIFVEILRYFFEVDL